MEPTSIPVCIPRPKSLNLQEEAGVSSKAQPSPGGTSAMRKDFLKLSLEQRCCYSVEKPADVLATGDQAQANSNADPAPQSSIEVFEIVYRIL